MTSPAAPVDLCTIPAGKSPNGVYNFVDPASLFPPILAVGVALLVVSTVFVVGRLFVNRHKLRIADYMTLIACLMNITYTGLTLARPYAYRHIWDTPVCDFDGESLKILFVQTMFFGPAFFFAKAAILLLYKQLFAIGDHLKLVINLSIIVVLLLYLSEFPLAAIYGAPKPGHSWDSLLESLEKNSQPFALGGAVQSAISTAVDIFIFILPMPILWKLQIVPRRRFQLLGIFSTALLGVGASIASLVMKIRLMTSTDSSWLGAQATLCTTIELDIALIVGCMPAFARFVTIYVHESAFMKSLRSRLLSRSTRNGEISAPSKDVSSEQLPKPLTIGSSPLPKRSSYYEMTDSMLLASQATMDDDSTEMDIRSKLSSSQTHTEHVV